MDWFTREITTGIQKLLFLRLPGCPASDMIPGTVAAWTDALTFNRVWDEARDTQRIRHAFRALGATESEWPAPSDLVRNLPRIESLLALPKKVVSDEVAQKNIARIKAMLAENNDEQPGEAP